MSSGIFSLTGSGAEENAARQGIPCAAAAAGQVPAAAGARSPSRGAPPGSPPQSPAAGEAAALSRTLRKEVVGESLFLISLRLNLWLRLRLAAPTFTCFLMDPAKPDRCWP